MINGRRVDASHDDAHVERGAAFEFTFDGREVPAHEGETVGAALVASGILTLRTTRLSGRPRGLFCGIGMCFDCLVVIDGVPNQRACRVPAQPRLVVCTQKGVSEESFGD
jgi:predicted molibdopterin-dependent oxidoreductase YjgC